MTNKPIKLTQAVALLTLLAATSVAQAQLLKDPQWQSWLDTGRSDELERAAQARLTAQPDDAQAAVALGLAALDGGEAKRLEAAVKPLQACVDRPPAVAACYYALGSVQGVQAMNGGMLKAISLSGSIKDKLSRAVELDPLMYEARQALSQFYLMAPGVAGGSVTKARELAQAAQAKQPEHAKLLRASIAGQDSNLAEMERELGSVKPGDDKALQVELRDAWFQVGLLAFKEKKYPKAKSVFELMARDYPGHAVGPYGLARVLAETEQLDEAIKQYGRARALDGADKLPVDYRLGLALLSKGDKAQAKQALERYVVSKKANPRNVEDARKRLAELG